MTTATPTLPVDTARSDGLSVPAASAASFDASPDPDDDSQIEAWISKAHRGGNLAALSALSAFQRQMDRYPQLDTAVIEELFVDIRTGEEALETMTRGRRLSDRRLRQLKDQIRRGDRAVEAVAGSTFRLVLVICREQAERRYGKERATDALGDLVGEANVALMESIRKFNPSYGPSFPTYAARVIRNQVRYVLQRDGMVRSTASWGRMRRIAAVRIPQLESKLGRKPTEAEIRENLMAYCMEWAEQHLTAAERKLPPAQREARMQEKLTKQGMIGALNNLTDVLLTSQPMASLDAPIAGTDGAYLGDMVAAPESDGFDELELSELRDTLDEALAALTDRERRIMRLRFGLEDGECWKYQAIGVEFGVTPERIRQIERQVMNRLRGPSVMRDKLAAFLPGVDPDTVDY